MTWQLPWVADAVCAQVDPDIFFPEDRGQTVESRTAKQICLTCPVLTECRSYALAHPEEWGIWGGMSVNERRQHRRGMWHNIREGIA